MKSAALLMLVLLTASYPAMAKSHHGHRSAARVTHHVARSSERESRSGITCEMVRAYVAQVGLTQAAAMAESAGITASEKERAKRCLAEKS
jgi:hypothetical protein